MIDTDRDADKGMEKKGHSYYSLGRRVCQMQWAVLGDSVTEAEADAWPLWSTV